MKTKAQLLWENKKLFGSVDGIVYNDKIIILDYFKSINTTNDIYNSFVMGETTIEKEIEQYPSYYYYEFDGIATTMPNPYDILEIGVSIGISSKSPIQSHIGNIYFGEGSMGNEGFVACTDSHNNFIWSIFFDFTNPLISGHIEDNFLYLYSSDTTEVSINLDDITKISIKPVEY